MEYIELKHSNLRISRIALGTWSLGGAPFFRDQPLQTLEAALVAAQEVGINVIDTAPVYGFGRADELLGEVLRKWPSSRSFSIATKCGLRWSKDRSATAAIDSISIENSRQQIISDLHDSLTRLGREYIDLLQMHWPDAAPEESIPIVIETFKELKKAGKIRAFGISNCPCSLISLSSSVGEISSVQNRFSILSEDDAFTAVSHCAKQGINFIAYSPLHRGLLTDDFRKDFRASKEAMLERIADEPTYSSNVEKAAQLHLVAAELGLPLHILALSFMLRHLPVSISIVGSTRADRIRSLRSVFDVSLSDDTLVRVKEVICRLYSE